MRKRGPVASPAGLSGTTDHLCRGYDSPEDHRAAVVTWIGAGLADDLDAYADGDTVGLAGEVDGLSIGTLLRVIEAMIHDGDTRLDVSELRFVDGRAAATIHAELARRRAGGHPIQLANPSAAVRRIWELCGFDQEVLAG